MTNQIRYLASLTLLLLMYICLKQKIYANLQPAEQKNCRHCKMKVKLDRMPYVRFCAPPERKAIRRAGSHCMQLLRSRYVKGDRYNSLNLT